MRSAVSWFRTETERRLRQRADIAPSTTPAATTEANRESDHSSCLTWLRRRLECALRVVHTGRVVVVFVDCAGERHAKT